MKIKILGSNGWYSTKTGNTICSLIDTKNYYIILDAGEGMNKLDELINSDKQIFLFLSHFHLDHIYGLHILNKFKFHQPLKIFGPTRAKKILSKIIASPYTKPLKKLKIQVIIKDLTEGVNNPPDTPFPVECRYLIHVDPCVGYRLNIDDGKIITYCVDTGVCDNMLRLSRNADVLITECSLKPRQRYTEWPHLNPEDSAKVAKKMKVGKLLLTHFDAISYKTFKERKEAEKVAKKIFPNTIACYDGLELTI